MTFIYSPVILQQGSHSRGQSREWEEEEEEEEEGGEEVAVVREGLEGTSHPLDGRFFIVLLKSFSLHVNVNMRGRGGEIDRILFPPLLVPPEYPLRRVSGPP